MGDAAIRESVEDKLRKYTMYKISIENLQAKIALLKNEDNDGLEGIDYDQIPTSETHAINSIVEDQVISLEEKIGYFQRQIDRMQLKVDSIDRSFKGLNEIERKVVDGFYINGRQWWEVAAEVQYSERTCKNIRTAAVDKLVIGMYGE